MSENYDVVILGAGPGGYVAAIRSAQLGLKVAVVEANHLGGICLNWGCIPTKALLRSAEVFHTASNMPHFGLKALKPSFDIGEVVKRSRDVSAQLTGGIKHLFKKNKITHIEGYGRLKGNGVVEVEHGKKREEIKAKNIIIATGARARVLPGFEPDGKLVVTYKEAMTPEKMPKSVIIVGSGAIGVEFASFYNSLGAEVTILEVQDKILPVEDKEISQFAHKAFEKQGLRIMTSANIRKLTKAKNDVTLEVEHKSKNHTLKAEKLIMAVGIIANIEDIGLDKTKVKTEKGRIVVDKFMATSEPGVYAIGDVVGAPWLAHKASHEGIIVAEKIAGKKPHPIKQENIPGCTYSMPQIASVGFTEEQCKEKGLKVKIGRFPFLGNGKAIALGEPEGLVKVIFDEKTGELLGAHLVGAEVTELIHSLVLAKTLEATEAEIMHTIFPHPTLSEMLHEAVQDAYGRVIHM